MGDGLSGSEAEARVRALLKADFTKREEPDHAVGLQRPMKRTEG